MDDEPSQPELGSEFLRDEPQGSEIGSIEDLEDLDKRCPPHHGKPDRDFDSILPEHLQSGHISTPSEDEWFQEH